MGEFVDKVKGAANSTAGAVKSAVGDAANRPDVEAEGEAQRTKGDLQQTAGTLKGAVGDKI